MEEDTDLPDPAITDNATRVTRQSKIILLCFLSLSTLLFDLAVSSSSTLIFRFIYDLSFVLLMFVLGYTALLLLTGRRLPKKSFNLLFPKIVYPIIILFNFYAIISVVSLDTPSIGYFSENMLSQGASALLPLGIFIVLIAGNALVLNIIVHGEANVNLPKLAVYALSIIAIETSLSIYAFYLGGLSGIRWVLFVFSIIFIGLAAWSFFRFRSRRICLKVGLSDALLIVLSVSIFAFVFVPFGLYNLYADNAVIAGNTLSIVNRGSLQPYYSADNYYSPIMGFVSIFFAYVTSLDNILLSANLPFLVASIFLPFVTYGFFKVFVTRDPRIALIGAISVSLMDGLAVFLLPVYAGGITNYVLLRDISPATQSLYFSNISQLFLTPYKIFAAVSAIGACCILERKHIATFVLGGGLFFMSFSDPRLSIITILLMVLLIGLKRVDMKGLIIFGLSTLLFAGFTVGVHFYKQWLAASTVFLEKGLIDSAMFNAVIAFLANLVATDSFVPYLIVLVTLLCLLLVMFFASRRKPKPVADDFLVFEPRKRFEHLDVISVKRWFFSYESIICFSAIVAVFVYVLFYAYHPAIGIFVDSLPFLSVLSNTVVRYHILIAFVFTGILVLRCNRRLTLACILLALVFFIAAPISNSVTIIPIVLVALALPILEYFVRHRKKIVVFTLVLFLFLGCFSSTLYASTVPSQNFSDYSDLPAVLSILLKQKPGELVYSPSYYTYYVGRVVLMAHLNLTTTNSSCPLYIIDKNYVNASVEDLLASGNFTEIFSGNTFVLLNRTVASRYSSFT